MNIARKFVFILLAAVIVTLALGCNTESPPVASTPPTQNLNDRIQHARAVEAVIWGMPAVNYDLMLQQMLTTVGQVIYWGRPLDSKNQTLTPNPDALYFMVFFNTKDGPVVLDLPPASPTGSFNANIVTLWQMPLEDVGPPRGRQRQRRQVRRHSSRLQRQSLPWASSLSQSDTFGGYMLFRANFKSHCCLLTSPPPSPTASRCAFYPLRSTPRILPLTVFTDVKDIDFDSTIKLRLHLLRSPQKTSSSSENWINRDRAMIDQLASLGIEKGKPFQPDNSHALPAHLRRAGRPHLPSTARYDAGFPPFFSATSHWMYPSPIPTLVQATQSSLHRPRHLPRRRPAGVAYSYAFIGLKRLGAGQMYLISIKDKDGNAFDGSKT